MPILTPGHMRFRDSEGELHFESPLEIIQAYSIEEVLPTLEKVQRAVDGGACAAGFLAYEAAPAFDSALRCHSPGEFPLLYFGIYNKPRRVASLVPKSQIDSPHEWSPLLSETEYRQTVEKIREHIAAGDTYQVNYTFPLEAEFAQDPDDSFDALCAAQGAPKDGGFYAYIHTERYSILSMSPEKYFTLDGDTITVAPMKGTRPRGLYAEEDQRLANELRESEKDLAENLMIVDLLRSDLGRIAETGTVQVREMFKVEAWNTVWQMSSVIEAKTHAALPEIMRALFPSGSVTGAPKVKTMQLIKQFEPFSRGVYCGAIGYITPQRQARFNVAIRTLTIDRQEARGRYNIGSGITWDSSAQDEYRECLDKARVLQYNRPDFSLLETMRLEDGNIALLKEHLERMGKSASYFGIPFNEEEIRKRLLEITEKAPSKLRLLLTQGGEITVEVGPLPETKIWRVALALTPVQSDNVFLYHKTTYRSFYDEKRKECPDYDDVILWNERGELTESTFANLVFEIDGTHYTPSISCGLLGGTLRQKLLEEGKLQERVLYKDDIRNASSISLINSMRGWIKVELIAPSSA